MRLAVLNTRFAGVNTFLVRDLLGLLGEGVALELWLWDDRHVPAVLAQALAGAGGEVRRMPRPWSLAALRALASEAIGRPRRLAASIARGLAAVPRSPKEGAGALAVLPTALALAREFERNGTTQTHALWAGVPATIGMWIHRHSDIPFGFSAHAWDITSRANLLGDKVKAARGVLVCSRFAREAVVAVAPERGTEVHLVHHGLDLHSWPFAPARDDDPPMILAVGRLTPKKGFDFLIRACAILRDEGIAFRCEIVGPEWRSGDALRNLIAELGLGEHVGLAGSVPVQEVRSRMCRAILLASPSVKTDAGDSDGIPNVVLEAMAVGTIVVGTDAGGIPEVVRDGVTGWVVPQRDPRALAGAMRSVLESPERRHAMVLEARRTIERDFDGRVTARKFLAGIGLTDAAGAGDAR